MSQPTSISFRALCAELVNELYDYIVANEQYNDALVNRTRAELVKPEPQGLELVYRYCPVTIAECGGPCEQGPEYCDCGEIKGEPPSQPDQPVSEHRPVWTEGICGDGAAILKDGVMQPIEDVIAALNATSLAQPPASWWRSAGPTNYSEDFWRRDALEKLVHAAASFRLGVYSAEELEIFENRARAILARWGHPVIEPVPTPEPGVADHVTDDEGTRWDRTTDAALWAKAFCLICPEMASREDVMISWFANAIMAGCDHQAWKMDAERKPIPVSERLPGAEDCDEKGRCWAWNPQAFWWDLCQLKFIKMNAGDPFTYWLPIWALPVPSSPTPETP
jgi:hypothetical protein